MSNQPISSIDPLRLALSISPVKTCSIRPLFSADCSTLSWALLMPRTYPTVIYRVLWSYNTATPSTHDSQAVTLELMREIAPAAIVATYINTRNARCFWDAGVIAEVPHCADLESVW